MSRRLVKRVSGVPSTVEGCGTRTGIHTPAVRSAYVLYHNVVGNLDSWGVHFFHIIIIIIIIITITIIRIIIIIVTIIIIIIII